MTEEKPDAQPYQSPREVPESRAGGAIIRSPIIWIAAIGLFAVIAGAASLMTVSDHVEEFGEGRMMIDDAYEPPPPTE